MKCQQLFFTEYANKQLHNAVGNCIKCLLKSSCAVIHGIIDIVTNLPPLTLLVKKALSDIKIA